MGFFDVYLPIAQMSLSVPLLLGLGLCVGIMGGFFGIGGGWIVTPALNMFGLDMSFAIGTGLTYMFGQSMIATRKHSRLGNVDFRLGLVSLVGSAVGVELGAQSLLALESSGSVGPVVRWLYIGLLLGLGGYMVNDHVRTTRREAAAGSSPRAPAAFGPSLPRKLQALRIPPMISLPTSGIERVSLPVILAIFTATGFLSGLMGVGGGFILLPALIYLVGCPTAIAVGSSLLCVLFVAGYGSFSYALKGRTELVAAVVMLVGAAAGTQIGVLATRYVRGRGIRLLFAVMILVAGFSVSLKQAEGHLELPYLGALAGYIVLAAAGGMALLIALKLVQGAAAETVRRAPVPRAGGSRPSATRPGAPGSPPEGSSTVGTRSP